MGLLQRRKTAFATALLAGALALGCNESSRSGEAGGSERAGQQAKGATDTPVSAISTASRREIPPPPGTHGWPEPVLTLHLLPDKDDAPSRWTAVVQHNTYGHIVVQDLALGTTASGPEAEAEAEGLRGRAESLGLGSKGLRAILLPQLPLSTNSALLAFPNADRGIDSRPAEAQMVKPGGLTALPAPEGTGSWWPLGLVDNPPFGPFDHYFDLTGDGSILLLDAPGPANGYWLLYLRMPRGPVLLGGAIVRKTENLSKRRIAAAEPPKGIDVEATRRSLGKVLALVDAYPTTQVLPGDEPELATKWQRADIRIHRHTSSGAKPQEGP